MKKNYVAPTNEVLLFDADSIYTALGTSSEAKWSNLDSKDFSSLDFN